METVVAQVSRYLDRIGAASSPRKHPLLMTAFSRALHRYAAKSARLRPIGDSNDLSSYITDERWIAGIHSRLQLEDVVQKLSARNGDVLVLRAAGYEWKEIATALGVSVAAVRNDFWREINQIRHTFFSSGVPLPKPQDTPKFRSFG